MKRIHFCLSLVFLLFFVYSPAQQSPLMKGFLAPPDSLRPSCYWYWLNDNISPQGVKKDVEAMAEIGIGRAFVGNIGLSTDEVPYGSVKMFSDGWWKTVHTAFATASSKNISLGLFNGPGWSQSGGPWVKPSQSMRYLASSETVVEGPRVFREQLPLPATGAQDVAVLAFPQPASEGSDISSLHPKITSDGPINHVDNAFDGDTATAALFSAAAGSRSVVNIDIQTSAAYIARSLTVYPAPQPLHATMQLQVRGDDGFVTIREFDFNRINPARNTGFMPWGPVIISFPETSASHFRLVVTNIQGHGGLAEVRLSAAARVERTVEKQLGKMFATPLPLWNEYQWPRQAEPAGDQLMVDPGTVRNLTAQFSNGVLAWNVPAGKWVIVRYAMAPTGVTNAPATPEGQGLEVDKMNKDVLEHHFQSFVGMIQNRLSPTERKALKWVVADSYETGSQNWTDGMAPAFKKVYGYDPLPWLPTLSGRVVGSQDQSDRFLWDLRRFIADRVSYQYVGGLRDVSHRHGLKLWLENYGHWGFPGEFLQYGGQSDEIGGEFWNEGDLGSIECKAASSAAHIYGKKKVAAESFTAGGLTYLRYPALLKKKADWSFTEGINSTLLHVMVEQPSEDKQPGINAGFGTEFNRHNTWFAQGKSFVDYLKRCNFLLQQGLPVNDVAYFIGEDAPKMTGIRDPALPQGYSFDYINAEVILKRLRVKNGRLVLPDGLSYRLLVLPQLETMRPELLARVKQLVAEGGVILGPKPSRSPSLQNYPASDRRVKNLADSLWSGVAGGETHTAFGKGMVIDGMNMEQAFDLLKLAPDFKRNTNDSILYIHRTTANGEVYFVSNQQNKQVEFAPEFRVRNKQPELWDAVTGSTRDLHQYSVTANGTIVPLRLAPYQSAFIVFNKAAAAPLASAKNFVSSIEAGRLSNAWTVQFDAASGGPAEAVSFDRLEDWSKRPEENIRDYSGTAIYATHFNYDGSKAGERLYLDLGKVVALATVTLNGKELGTVWTSPWRIDITQAVKKGDNSLSVRVSNTLVNRMIGDKKRPMSERKVWSNVNPYTPDSHYQSAGLMGPVTLQAEGSDSLGSMRYLFNDKVKLGIDLNLGGAITYLSSAKDNINMINNSDWGRQIQMSFYSGPVPFEPDGKKAAKFWTFIGWNPIQSGDVAGNRSQVLDYRNNGREIYVKCIPMHWPLDNVPGECTYECWISLEGNVAKVRSRIVNNRPDTTQYPARTQELPAVYTNAPYHHLMTYRGSKPFMHDTVGEIRNHNFPGAPTIQWEPWQATENWAANVNDAGVGLGIWAPGVQQFTGGYFGDSLFRGGSKDSPTEYIAPNSEDILDHNIDYDYHYTLIAGSVQEIRDYVYAQHQERLPSYNFAKDRQRWYYEHASDSGWPIKGGLDIALAPGAAAIGPLSWWKSADAHTVRVRGSWPSGIRQARLFWRRFGDKGFDISRSVAFEVKGDGQPQTCLVNLDKADNYNGDIVQLKLQFDADGTAGGRVKLESLELSK